MIGCERNQSFAWNGLLGGVKAFPLVLPRPESFVWRNGLSITPGEDGYIISECPVLPGRVSQGKTRREALQNIQEAIAGIIEVRKAQKLPIPSPDNVEISERIKSLATHRLRPRGAKSVRENRFHLPP